MIEYQHTGISVTDIDRTIAWYAEHFGFTEVKRFEKSEMEIRGAIMSLGNAVLEILQPDSPAPVGENCHTLIEHLRKLGANHIAIGVSDIAGCFEQFRKDNVDLVSELIDDRFFFCKDPDGILIEVRHIA